MREIAEQPEEGLKTFNTDAALERLAGHGVALVEGVLDRGDHETIGLEEQYGRFFDRFPNAFCAVDSYMVDPCGSVRAFGQGRITRVNRVPITDEHREKVRKAVEAHNWAPKNSGWESSRAIPGSDLPPLPLGPSIDGQGVALWMIPNFHRDYARAKAQKLNFDWRSIVEKALDTLHENSEALDRVIPIVLEIFPMTGEEAAFAAEKNMFICSLGKDEVVEKGEVVARLFENLAQAIEGYPDSYDQQSLHNNHLLELGTGRVLSLVDKKQLWEFSIIAAAREAVNLVRKRRARS
ncbi:MAG: hypothetical protein WC873_01810 [Candidatus Gracilibacteria bacterium]